MKNTFFLLGYFGGSCCPHLYTRSSSMESRITAGCFFFYRFYWTEPPRKIQAPFRKKTSRLGYQRTDCLQSLAIQIHRFFFSGEKHRWTMVFFFQAPNWRNMSKSDWKSKLPVSIVVKRDKEILETPTSHGTLTLPQNHGNQWKKVVVDVLCTSTLGSL